MKNEIEKIKVEMPTEQQDESIPTEEWYYIPFYKTGILNQTFWEITPINSGKDYRIKQSAVDSLNAYSWVSMENKKIIKIRLPIIEFKKPNPPNQLLTDKP